MPTSRRDFIRSTGLAAAGLSLLPQIAEAATAVAGVSPPRETPPGKVRGLLFDETDLPRMRKAVKHPHVAPYWDSIVKADLAADATFIREQARFNNHAKDILQVRQILERTAFVFAVTGDTSQGDVALMAVDKLLAYPKWDYFLEGGELVIGLQRAPESTIAMVCAREWLAPLLSEEKAREIEKQIGEKGAPACYRTLYGLKYPDRVRGWGFDPEDVYPYRFDLSRWPFILNSTNLKAIPIAGLGLAGCLLRGKHPQAERWIDMAVGSAKSFAAMFGPDGSYDEGVGYWGYTALHLTLLVEAVRRTVGTDLSGIINYPGTVRYGLRMSMPTSGRPSDCVDFGDAWAMGDVSIAAWVARRFKDPIAQHVATNVGELKNHYAVIWLDPALPSKKPGPELHDVRFANDWVVARSGWGEADGVVALRSGGPANHEHADRNSVIFKAYGERLMHDPYHAAYSYTEPEWFLRLTEAHTSVLVNGRGHQYHDGHEGTNASWAEAKVLEYRSAPASMIVTSDATDAYRLVNGDVERVDRTLVFLKPDVLILFDRLRLKNNAVPVQLRFQVDNSDGKGSVDVQGDGFTVLRPGASMQASLYGGGGMTLRTGTLNIPADKGTYPFAEVESRPALDHLLLTVCTAQKARGAHGSLNVRHDGQRWHIEGTHNGRTVTATIADGGEIPQITVG